MASSDDWRARLHARSGAGIEADALADFLGRRRAVRRWSEWLAVVLALPVLLTPWALAGVAAWVLWLEWFSLVGCLYGGLLLATGWWLRPRRTAPVAGQGRADLPLTFGLLDRLCAETGAPLIDRLEVNQQFNAFVTTRRGKRLLGLGVLLWAALEPAEKLALLGHELGHLVNNDPARRVIVHQAMATLDRWRYLIRPDGVMSAVLWGGPYLLIGLWAEVLGRLIFVASQRAEYLADGLSARLAGAAAVTTLEKVALGDLVTEEMRHGQADQATSGSDLVTRIAGRVRRADPARHNEIMAQTLAERRSVDATHPPTGFRIAFLRALDEPGTIDRSMLAALHLAEVELGTLIEAAGNRLQDQLIRQ